MKLTRTQIRHYKSLSDVVVDLHPQVTVLVGPNAVGKTNYVDALRFLRDAARDGIDHAIVSRGGMMRVRQYSTTGRPPNIGFAIDALQSFDESPDEPVNYALDIGSVSGGNYKIEREEANSYREDWVPAREPDESDETALFYEGFVRDKAGYVIKKGQRSKDRISIGEQDRLALGALIGDHEFRSLGAHMHNYICQWKFAALYPNTLRLLTTPDTDVMLREDGSNWASVIRSAKRTARGKRMLDRINEMMRVVLPDFLDVTVSTAGSYLVPTFRFQGESKAIREFDAVQLSDGTLRIFGILLSLYQSPAPSLIVIEEPEQTVHPAVLSMLAEAFQEVSELTQIIVTTHSPQLIEHFTPENIRIVTMHDGVTQIAPIKASQREAVQRGLMTLGEFMSAEGLLPETTP
ncbi:MAG: ATPase [Comamonadaceae bacterium SCN 68-20]|nr:MAG: ATPase [Comamonadaceae bacterium SCN 68-20]OJX30871.1 MAG: ATPase [Burkholderiales bacterium 68-20]